jgi:hypothetical protein
MVWRLASMIAESGGWWVPWGVARRALMCVQSNCEVSSGRRSPAFWYAAATSLLLIVGAIWFTPKRSSSTPSGVPPRSDVRATRTPPSLTLERRRPRERSLQREPSARSLRGSVQATNGQALPEASVCASSGGVPNQCVLTDSAGYFELHHVPTSVTELTASALGYLARERSLTRHEDAQTITLEQGGAEVLGTVVDGNGGTVPFATVTLRPQQRARDATFVISGPNGHFRASVPEGQLIVVAEADGYSQAVARARAPARGVRLVLAHGAEIVGRVVDQVTEKPVAGVAVSATPPSDDLDARRVAMSDSDGEFRIAGLPGGGYHELKASSADWYASAQSVLVNIGEVSELVQVRVSRATTVTVTVNGADDGCADGQVLIRGPSNAAAQPDAQGVARLEGLVRGFHRVDIRCPGSLPIVDTIQIGTEPIAVAWTVERGLSVSGRVQTPSGEAVSDALVSVSPLGEIGDSLAANCVSTPGGEFTCSGLIPGEYECAVEDAGDPGRERQSVTLSELSVDGVLLRTRPYGVIRVSVTGRGAEGDAYHVFARGSVVGPLEASPRGQAFVLERVPLGRYEVYVDLPTSGSLAEVKLERDGQVIELELPAPPLRGRSWTRAGRRSSMRGSASCRATCVLATPWRSTRRLSPMSSGSSSSRA